MLNLFKKKTELDILRKAFSFLENDFGYIMITGETQKFYKGKNLLIYRNDDAEKQIEICGGGSFFHCIIRRIENNQLFDYHNRKENIGFEDLAILDNPKYDHFDFYAGGSTGVDGVTTNTIALLKRQREFLAMTKWIDLEKVEQLKNEDFKSRFGKERPKHKGFFIDEIKEMVKNEYPDFKLVFNNRTFPHYHEDSTLEKLVYRFGNNDITIRQVDWRDFPRIFRILFNDNLIFEIDASKVENEVALEKIKTACNKVYSQ